MEKYISVDSGRQECFNRIAEDITNFKKIVLLFTREKFI